MEPQDHDWEALMEKLRLFQSTWPSPTWEWDSRFTMIASAFDKAQELAARESAATLLTYAWTSATLVNAPTGLQEICSRSGGLRGGQMLMAGKAGGLVLYGLWWPWGGGSKITLRLGIGECEVMEPPFPQVRHMFNVRM
ncbi:MAG: hypothetical protein H0T89_09125 [Deltaproteobacteria bacterium]|nr:hypothetical protein [Deltaproteobacteria bacterium]MDQ3295985.1 hypothetical protein [Myxococcota bacterium]